MEFPGVGALHAVCKRYGSGRIPGADDRAIGAGYAGASAALCATVLFAVVATVVDPIGLQGAGLANVWIAALAFPFVVPAAFAIGACGWKTWSPQSAFGGTIAGVIGAVVTYGLVLVLFGLPLTAVEAYGGGDPIRTAVFPWGVIYFAFAETWCVALPVGTASGFVYAAVVSRTD